MEERKKKKMIFFYPSAPFLIFQNGKKIGEKMSYIGNLTILSL